MNDRFRQIAGYTLIILWRLACVAILWFVLRSVAENQGFLGNQLLEIVFVSVALVALALPPLGLERRVLRRSPDELPGVERHPL